MSVVRVVVYHGYYGCDTGCCGHYVQFPDGTESQFEFAHPYSSDAEAQREWALEFAREAVEEKFGKEHTADLDWENSLVIDD